MDVVYFYRDVPRSQVIGRGTDELRYSLRSLAANMADLGEVHLFGGRPPWVSEHVSYYPVKQVGRKHENTWRIWRQIASAARNGYLPEWFLIMNDDFFLISPLADAVPAYVTGPLGRWLAERSGTVLREAGMRTQAFIAARGVPVEHQLGYELHVPFLVHGPSLVELWPALDQATNNAGGSTARRLMKRSIIGNLTPGMNAGAELMPGDVKIFGNGRDPAGDPPGPWVSTSDDSFARRNVSPVGVSIRAALRSRCRFEAPDVVPADRRQAAGAPRVVRPR